MYSIIVNTIAISIVLVATGRAYHIVEYPCWSVVSLNGRLHIEHTTQHVTQITIQTLYILIGIRYCQVVLIGVRINKTGTELHELCIHRVVNTSSITLEVWTSTLEGTLLIIVIKTYIIGIINTTTTQVHAVVLTDTCLESLSQPVGISIITEVIVTIST